MISHAHPSWIKLRDSLVAEAADRPAHASFLAELLACPSGEAANELADPAPRGVSDSVADALLTDAWWLLDFDPNATQRAQWPGEYRACRLRGHRAASTRRHLAEARAQGASADNLAGLMSQILGR